METTMDAVASAPRDRVLVLKMDDMTKDALKLALGGALSGGVVLEAMKRLFSWRNRKQKEPVELQMRVLDSDDELRKGLLERESRFFEREERLRAAKDAAIERAHQVEMELAVSRAKEMTLEKRLTRKDEQCKALQRQVIGLGAMPVYLNAPDGHQEV